GELNYRVEDAQKTIAAVKDHFTGRGSEDFTDGFSLTGDDWRFNIRPSNTEPLLRLNVEALKPGLSKRFTPKSKPSSAPNHTKNPHRRRTLGSARMASGSPHPSRF